MTQSMHVWQRVKCGRRRGCCRSLSNIGGSVVPTRAGVKAGTWCASVQFPVAGHRRPFRRRQGDSASVSSLQVAVCRNGQEANGLRYAGCSGRRCDRHPSGRNAGRCGHRYLAGIGGRFGRRDGTSTEPRSESGNEGRGRCGSRAGGEGRSEPDVGRGKGRDRTPDFCPQTPYRGG
jgi:hypothetical protein